MADREKVIKAIEDCVFHNHDCVDCDYDGCVFKHGDCRWDLLADALTMLKEQEEQIKTRDESLEKAREEIKWLRGMLKEQEAVNQKLMRSCIRIVRNARYWSMRRGNFALGADRR